MSEEIIGILRNGLESLKTTKNFSFALSNKSLILILVSIAIIISASILTYMIFSKPNEKTFERQRRFYPYDYGMPTEPPPPITVPSITWDTAKIKNRNGKSDIDWAAQIYDKMVAAPTNSIGYTWVDERWLRGKSTIDKQTADNLCVRPCSYFYPKDLMLFNGLCDCEYPIQAINF
jgi:hypothetical protein